MSPRDHAIGLYMEGIRDGAPHEALAAHTGARYTQHSTGVADGREGFLAFFEPFLARNPKRDIRVVRALEDGAHVFVHAYQSLNDGADQWVTMDFFDSDADGKIVEHWDVIAPFNGHTASGRTSVDGETEITDPDQTAANKALIAAFFDICLIGRETDRMGAFIAPDLLQHSPDLGDGLDSFQSFYAAADCPLSYQERFLMVGEGSFVATLNRAKWDDQDLCRANLFRIAGGKIVEHWDLSEPVPPREDWANSGKF
ncbi:MAG: nuclear transport factor 2 family protein [Pseudomonadota bacterium]